MVVFGNEPFVADIDSVKQKTQPVKVGINIFVIPVKTGIQTIAFVYYDTAGFPLSREWQ